MADLWYARAMRNMVKGDLDFDTIDLYIALVMTNTTADTERDSATISAITTLDEMDGANYARKKLSSQTVTEDLANDRIEIDVADITWSALGNGTRQIQGYLVFYQPTSSGSGQSDANCIPIAYRDLSATVNPGGSDFTIQVDAEGLLQVRSLN